MCPMCLTPEEMRYVAELETSLWGINPQTQEHKAVCLYQMDPSYSSDPFRKVILQSLSFKETTRVMKPKHGENAKVF